MTKRKDKRINKSLLVNLSRNGYESLGVTVNISRRGMFIATTEVFPVHSEFQILLAAADDIYAMTGIVIWNIQGMNTAGDNVPAGLGIKIKGADLAYADYIKAIANTLRTAHSN
ncbi:MAG: PilZ domain-containing protein [Candidatus Aminicenantes bacterium]|nr:PilZ domain-containing protein [Candidatus Aminicenantes bacterium]